MRTSLMWTFVAVLGLSGASDTARALTIAYDAGVAGSGPADLDPVLQGWNANDADRSGGATANVFDLRPDGTTGFNAILINDQFDTSTPSADNPRYEVFMTDVDFKQMYDFGWTLRARYRPVQGGNFVGWGINPASVTDPGWGLTTRERVGFGVSINTSDNSAVISPIHGSGLNLGPDSANSYHLIEVFGGPESSQYEFVVNGTSQGFFDIKDGTSNSGSDNRIFFESGSGAGVGRAAAWNFVGLVAVPEPATLITLCVGLLATGMRRVRSWRQ